MTGPHFGTMSFMGWEIVDYDRRGTLDAYHRFTPDPAAGCQCAHCRNFRAAGDRAYTLMFRAFLDTFGLDARKIATFSHQGRVADDSHLYDGAFHLIGRLMDMASGQTVSMEEKTLIRLRPPETEPIPTLRGLPLVEVEVRTVVPWVLERTGAEVARGGIELGLRYRA